MATIEMTRENFEEVVTKNEMVVVDFWAAWCGPCKGFAPVFEAASAKHGGVVFAKVDADAQQELAASFNVRSIPFLMLRENVVLFAQAGALPAEALDSIISQARALDMEQVRKEIAEQEQQQQQNQQQQQ
jgi:thioredoxin 1